MSTDKAEESLDPIDWKELRSLGRRMVDEMITYLQTVRERPVWQPVPDEVKLQFKQPAPQQPQGSRQAYEDFVRLVRPYPYGNIHPRFWGWVNGAGSPFGMLAEMLAAGMNSNVSFGDQAAVYVEQQVLDWCKEMLGYAADASGILVGGGSMANLIGLAVARNDRADFNVARQGLQMVPQRMVLYGSSEMHSSLQKAVELLGIGYESLRRIPVNAEYQIDIQALKQAIASDRYAGHYPFCVIGNAGTINTGAIDDLNQLADLCQEERLWFHIDGAFGALAVLSPELRPLLVGMERADSLAFDLHKWMHIPYDAACVLIRHPESHHQTFSASGTYLTHQTRGVAGAGHWFSEYGPQLSRGFRALKVWLSIKEHGIEKFRRLIEQNVEQARYLVSLISARPELELLAPAPLNIVCFRYVRKGQSKNQLNELNQEILLQLHESGIAVPSYTMLNGDFAIRVAITNHRSRRKDFEILVSGVVQRGNYLFAQRENKLCLGSSGKR